MSDNPLLKIDRLIMGDVYTSTESMDNLTILCDDFGSRFGGTEGERQAAEFLVEKMKAYGLSNVHLEPVDYVGWRRGQVKLEILEPVQKEIGCITLPHSPPANLEGYVVDMDDGAPNEFDERAEEISGKIVLTTSEVNPKGVKRWIHRSEKYGRSMMAGAAGFIFVNHYPAYGPATGGIGDNAEGPIPGISVAMEDGAYIQRLIKRFGAVKIRITSSDACQPMVSWNVVGELPGVKQPEKMVLMGSHYDGHDISQGAEDPASGTVAVMEAARVLAQYAGELPYTIRFVLWGIEEIGLIGSTAYVAAHPEEMDHVLFYLNMDSAGAVVNKGIVLNEWAELEPRFKQWSQEMALKFGVAQSVNAHSDHYPFLMVGVPTGGMGSVGGKGFSGRGYGHTRYDTLDKVTLVNLREAAVLAARLALRIAKDENWPASRRSVETVKELLDSPEYREEVAFNSRLEAYLKGLPNS